MPEMMWRPDANIDAARKLPGWRDFHRVCGRVGLYFDRMQKAGRGYTCDAFTAHRRRDHYVTEKLATGRGVSVVASVEAAYRASGRQTPETGAALDVLLGRDDDFDTLLVVSDNDFEEML